jgi:hypothetical protein
VKSALRRPVIGAREGFLGIRRQYIGQNCLQAVHQSSARETM